VITWCRETHRNLRKSLPWDCTKFLDRTPNTVGASFYFLRGKISNADNVVRICECFYFFYRCPNSCTGVICSCMMAGRWSSDSRRKCFTRKLSSRSPRTLCVVCYVWSAWAFMRSTSSEHVCTGLRDEPVCSTWLWPQPTNDRSDAVLVHSIFG